MSEQPNNEITQSTSESESEQPKYTKRSNQISRETSVLLSNLISNKETINPIESNYAKINPTMKAFNNNKAISKTKFQALYTEFLERETFEHANANLKLYLVDIFDLMRDNIELSELNARLSVQSISALVEGCLIAVISKVSKQDFDTITKDYDTKAISDKSLSSVKSNFNKILALIE
jgi:hypothetical protein